MRPTPNPRRRGVVSLRPEHEVVRQRVCCRKPCLSSAEARRQAEQRGDGHNAYPCPFWRVRTPRWRHWHVGHLPSMESLATVAAAIRDLPPAKDGGAARPREEARA
jgi:hypothetical protein